MTRIMRAAAAGIVLSALGTAGVGNAGASSVASATPAGSSGRAVPLKPLNGQLNGVAARSATDAWAVGGNGGGKNLIMHWNGARWSRVACPNPAGRPSGLFGVAALSARNAWAVGQVIVHWNGRAWQRVHNSGTARGTLIGVAATSARNVWAAGFSPTTPGRYKTLILHWNGRTWQRVS